MPVRRRSLAWLVLGVVLGPPGASTAQLTPPSTGGLPVLDRLLQQAAEPRRILMIGAHPDDEDTGLLARMALGDGAAAAYLSLSRGEGGQNLIGSELGAALGLVRTRELEAARAVDGARQFFTRAYDFGYTRDLDETSGKWPLDSLLKDATRIVRRFRPHVIASVFSGTPRDGHGQHQAAGVTARRVFEAAGDPGAFPELATEEGLLPWTPLKLYRSTRFDTAATSVAVPTGALDPRTGRSFHQIAMASRSQHRSQDMGQLQVLGPRVARLALLEDRTGLGRDAGVFDGIPVEDDRLGFFADSLRRHLAPITLPGIVEALARELPRHSGDPRVRLLEEALAVAAGVVIDGVSDDGDVTPGQQVAIEIDVFNGGAAPVVIENVRIVTPDGWTIDPVHLSGDTLGEGELQSDATTLRVPADAAASRPYFLVRPRRGDLYDWSATPPETRGLPFGPPPVVLEVRAAVHGTPFTVRREVAYRYRDQAVGEIRRPLRVVPTVDVKLAPDQLVWPVDQYASRTFTVTLTNNVDGLIRGDVELRIEGWDLPAAQRYRFERAGESRRFGFTVSPPTGVRSGEVTVRAVATGADGRTYAEGVDLITYPHIRPAWRVLEASSRVVLAPLVLPPVARVGYVRGAADRVPEALAEVGLPVEVLDGNALEGADLSVYEVIVVGSRAYEANEALQRHNDRLLAYARGGGHLVVQYQQYAFVRGEYAPYPLTIGFPHDRVTDEHAPVRLLEPDHPIFRGPNPVGDGTWADWPQERGLYFAQTWDPAYTPLIETNDPGRDPLRGGMLVADVGAGSYVYTGLAFFRALPAGNAGAFGLFLNLIGYRRTDVP